MKIFFNWLTDTFGNTWLAKEMGNIINSLNNNKIGNSGKKITIVTIMFCIIRLHNGYINHAINKDDWDLLPEILMIDFSTILLLFGINVWDKLKSEKHENS